MWRLISTVNLFLNFSESIAKKKRDKGILNEQTKRHSPEQEWE